MNNALPNVPPPRNEPVLSYGPGTPERAALREALTAMKTESVDIPAVIGGEEVRSGDTVTIRAPHDHAVELGQYHRADAATIARAADAAVAARAEWAAMSWAARSAVFLRAAELLAGPWRQKINAATMLGQSKNAFQAEIDAACELIDFWRFNAHYAEQIYREQPLSAPGMWNRLQFRALEGFVFAVTPFNFTSIAGNLPSAPAQMGNTAVWKPASTAVLSNYWIFKLLEEAGLPPGVINFLPSRGSEVGKVIFNHRDLAGLHFTGSTATFQHMWRTIGENIAGYRSYPRVVGETGGKDFILAHASADVDALATAVVRGGYEYQGQKCSAASRIYVPDTMWPALKEAIGAQLAEVQIGSVEDFGNFVNAVIDRAAYDKITGYIEQAVSEGAETVFGGDASDTQGFFVQPTLLRTEDPGSVTMREEIFGPVVTAYVYPEARWEETFRLVDETSPYALTGAVFANDRRAIEQASAALVDAAGNFYINDKPTGAVVGQQPFGGARGSGTNDKAGSVLNLMRWASARAIKETFDPPTHFGYPFLDPD